MTGLRARLHRLTRSGDRGSGGSMALFLLISALGLFIILGLVVDGGSRAQALDRANRIANEAARAGLQSAVIYNGNIDTAAVSAGVQQYLATEGVKGSSWIEGNTVHVEVLIKQPTKVLKMISIGELPVTGSGSADIIYRQ